MTEITRHPYDATVLVLISVAITFLSLYINTTNIACKKRTTVAVLHISVVSTLFIVRPVNDLRG